ncbi:hypothetical protein AcidC75_23520 [Acidisoma sp. C75]
MVVLFAPGAHGPTIAGRQGIGVCTPMAAAVAVITVGLMLELHIPKVGIFTSGAFIMIVATGMVVALAVLGGPSSVEMPGGSA